MAAGSADCANLPAFKNQFLKEKYECLNSSVDHSRKGCIDADIVDLVKDINSHDSYYTTSSCAGRMVVFCQPESKSDAAMVQKKDCRWLLVCHDVISGHEAIYEALRTDDRDDSALRSSAVFKFEPFVMHVRCQTLKDAQALHVLSLEAGFRNSGLTVNKNGKITLAIRSTHTMEVPLTRGEKILVSPEYLDFVISKANHKFQENRRRVKKFHAAVVKKLLEG